MKNGNALITKIKDISSLISSLGVILGLFIGVYAYFNEYKVNQDKITENLKITQRMALKSVIWNDTVPLLERASACDDYLSLGYNSYTKEYCNHLIKGVKIDD